MCQLVGTLAPVDHRQLASAEGQVRALQRDKQDLERRLQQAEGQAGGAVRAAGHSVLAPEEPAGTEPALLTPAVIRRGRAMRCCTPFSRIMTP